MKIVIITTILATTLALLVYTNPTMDDYADYIRDRTLRESGAESETGQQLAFALGGLAGHVLTNATERQNYVLFSTYTTDIGVRRTEYLGILGYFFKRAEAPAAD